MIQLPDVYNSVNEKTAPIYFYTISFFLAFLNYLSFPRQINISSRYRNKKQILRNFRQEDVITITTWLLYKCKETVTLKSAVWIDFAFLFCGKCKLFVQSYSEMQWMNGLGCICRTELRQQREIWLDKHSYAVCARSWGLSAASGNTGWGGSPIGTQPRDLLMAWLSFFAGDFCKTRGKNLVKLK